MTPSQLVACPLPAELVAQLDRYVVHNGVSRGAVLTAALISFIDQWRKFGADGGGQ